MHREDHCCAAHRGRAESTSSHEGRMGEGSLRARESAIGPGRDRRTADPDRAARPRARQQRRDRLRPLGSRRALRSTAGSSRPGAWWRCATSSSPQPSSGDDLTSAKPKRHTRPGPCPTRNSPSGLPRSTSQRRVNSTAANPSTTHRMDSRPGTSGAASLAAVGLLTSAPGSGDVTAGVRRPARRSRSRAPVGPAAAGSRTGPRAASLPSRRRRSPGCGGPRR